MACGLLAAGLGLASCGRNSNSFGLPLSSNDSVSEVQAVRVIADSLAQHTEILGSVGERYVTDVVVLGPSEAKAIIGQRDWESGIEQDDSRAYTLHLQRRVGRWAVISFDYIEESTGKKQIDTLDPPYPAPIWDSLNRGL